MRVYSECNIFIPVRQRPVFSIEAIIMKLYIRDLILLAHILLGITWLGGILFVGWGVYPAANKLPYRQQQKFLLILMKHVHLLLTLAGAGVISTGTILGTIYTVKIMGDGDVH